MKKYIIVAMTSIFACTQYAWATCTSPHPNIQPSRPDNLYIDNHDGTVTDKSTGLTWSKCSSGQTWIDNTPDDASDDTCSGTALTYNWKAALDSARSASDSSYLGLQGWRLPNVKELGSLMENDCSSPAINQSIFPSTANANYWSSSPYIPGSGLEAWHVGFQSAGEIFQDQKTSLFYIRLVRGGE